MVLPLTETSLSALRRWLNAKTGALGFIFPFRPLAGVALGGTKFNYSTAL